MGLLNVVIVQSTNRVWLFVTLWTAGRQAILFLIISWSLPTSCPLNRWCHPTILCSVTLFSFCLQFFPASGSFPMSRLFTSAGQSFGASSSASVLPVNIQGRFPLGWTSLISLKSKGFSRVFSHTTVQKHQFFTLSFLYSPTLTSRHDYWKNRQIFVGTVMSLLFNMLSRFVITFLPRSKHLLISC